MESDLILSVFACSFEVVDLSENLIDGCVVPMDLHMDLIDFAFEFYMSFTIDIDFHYELMNKYLYYSSSLSLYYTSI